MMVFELISTLILVIILTMVGIMSCIIMNLVLVSIIVVEVLCR